MHLDLKIVTPIIITDTSDINGDFTASTVMCYCIYDFVGCQNFYTYCKIQLFKNTW